MLVEPDVDGGLAALRVELVELYQAWRHYPCLVLANGPSRAGFDLARLRSTPVKVIGCNMPEVHDQFVPDLVVVIDGIALQARRRHGVTKTPEVSAQGGDIAVRYKITSRVFDQCGLSTGCAAACIAVTTGAFPIYLLGNDLTPKSRLHAGKELYDKNDGSPGNVVERRWYPTFVQLSRIVGGDRIREVRTSRVPGLRSLTDEELFAELESHPANRGLEDGEP